MFEEGVIVSKKATDAVDEQQKFKMYYDYREPVKQIPSHRMLAIRRGETVTWSCSRHSGRSDLVAIRWQLSPG